MLQVNIHQTFGQIGIDRVAPVFQVRQPPADFSLNPTPAQMEINRDAPKVHIDSTQTRASMGYKSIGELQADISEQARNDVLMAIARMSSEGDQVGNAAKRRGNPIADIAAGRLLSELDFNVGVIPSVPPKIDVTGGLEIRANMGQVNADIRARFPEISCQPGQLNVYLKVRPSIQIEVTGQNVDLRT